MNAVELHNLSKTYPGGKQAVRDVSLSLEPGEVFGFLGPNGAGKTTTVKLLNGMLTPTEGTCRVLGADPAREPEKVHAVSGVVTEHARMYDNLTGMQNLIFYAELFGLPADEAAGRAEALLREMELEEAKDRKLAAWSTGMRQRLSLARALIHGPKILFLDEPTSGLDPESAQNVNRMNHTSDPRGQHAAGNGIPPDRRSGIRDFDPLRRGDTGDRPPHRGSRRGYL